MSTYDSQPSDANMILIMGITGSGKSYLINKLAGRNVVVESDKLDSCTAVCQMVPVQIGGSKVLLIDTPGFDDTKRSDTEILTEISKVLATQYKLGVTLKGIIYLHRITDPRFQGSSAKTLKIFSKICGDTSLRNVFLCTTRWDQVEEHDGASRENRLREHFWAYMISKGSTMMRSYGDRESAVAMVSQLLGSASIVLDIQRELVDEGRSLDETSAGVEVNGNLTALVAQSKNDLAEIQRLQQELRDSDFAMRRKLEEDQRKEQARLRQAEVDQVRLRADIAAEVRDEINVEMSRMRKKSSGLGKVLPLLPAAISILGQFVGVPSAVTGLFSSWFTGDISGGSDGFDGFDGFFSEFFSGF